MRNGYVAKPPHVYRRWPAQTLTCIDGAQPNPSLVSSGTMKPNPPLVSTRPSPNHHLYRQVPAHHFTCIDGAQPNPSRVDNSYTAHHLHRQGPAQRHPSLVSTKASPIPNMLTVPTYLWAMA